MLDPTADPGKVILYHKNSNISILRKDLLCLQPSTWLNDEVVNVYMGLLQVTARKTEIRRKVRSRSDSSIWVHESLEALVISWGTLLSVAHA